MRFNVMPQGDFVVDFVDSMVTNRVQSASVAAPWESIYGGIAMPGGVLNEPSLTPAQAQQQFGQIFTPGGGFLGDVASLLGGL
jgi:hypothetical protein